MLTEYQFSNGLRGQHFWRMEVGRLTQHWHPSTARVTRALMRAAPTDGNAGRILKQFGQPLSSISSRYARARLLLPKQQLVLFRLTLALTLHDWPAHEVANLLDYSTSQAFCRHIRMWTGNTWTEFRGRWTAESFWNQSVAQSVEWDNPRWAEVDVLKEAAHMAKSGSRATFRA